MKKNPKRFFDEFPEELNPDLYKAHINFEEEEKKLQEEKKQKGIKEKL